jgi:predicted RNA-binding Zn-ribbon protein involved in translation (DUF1610 family)
MELPNFGSYIYSNAPGNTTETSDAPKQDAADAIETSKAYSSDASKMASFPYIGKQCPKCDGGILKSAKKNRNINIYVCDKCKKSTSENILRER